MCKTVWIKMKLYYLRWKWNCTIPYIILYATDISFLKVTTSCLKTLLALFLQIQNFTINWILVQPLPCIDKGVLELRLVLPALKRHFGLHPWPALLTNIKATGLTRIVLKHINAVLGKELHCRLCAVRRRPILLINEIVAKKVFDLLQYVNHQLLIGFCILGAFDDVERGAPSVPHSSVNTT